MTSEHQQKLAWLACFAVISVAVTGYFVGLQSPMNPLANAQAGSLGQTTGHDDSETAHPTTNVIPATAYTDMPLATATARQPFRTNLVDLKSVVDLFREIKITPEQKQVALNRRQQNRAFNGAPPTIPHAVEQNASVSCLACHGEGFQSKTLRISKMSHPFLANCTQCHVESVALPTNTTPFRENSFVGLPAPTGGPRSYSGAPPMIPHSTWMRENCMSCHGVAGLYGIRTTHPWRQNCQQCHAPSSQLDQVQLRSEPQFLPPPIIMQQD